MHPRRRSPGPLRLGAAVLVTALLLGVGGCHAPDPSRGAGEERDARAEADLTAPTDLRPADGGPLDVSVGPDLEPADAGPADGGPADLGPADLAAPDLSVDDGGQPELGTADGGPFDASGAGDGGSADAGPGDVGVPDAGLPDGGPADAGAPDEGPVVPADLGPPPPLPLGPVLSEVLAVNDGVLRDEDGDSSDWIELFNPHAVPLDLHGWHLTDDPDRPARWTFPEVTLAPGGFLLVWASGKDREQAGAPLHTDFRLSGGGEYLAVVAPDLRTVDSLVGLPTQLVDVAWGRPMLELRNELLAQGSLARYQVLGEAVAPPGWTATDFDDSAWPLGPTGLGGDRTGGAGGIPLVADSEADFSGQQGREGWIYGYWDLSEDPDGEYDPWQDFVPFPAAGGPHGPDSYFDGAAWVWPEPGAPATAIDAQGGAGAAAGLAPGVEHWAVRRWVANVSGRLVLSGEIGGTQGGGGIGRVLVEGLEVRSAAARERAQPYSLDVVVEPGTVVDLVADPGDQGGYVRLTARLSWPEAGLDTFVPELQVADSLGDWSVAGVQGAAGWTYGYYDRSADADGQYAAADLVPFPRSGAGFGPDDGWTGAAWDWYQGNPPWTYIGPDGVHSNGVNNGPEHWAIRRWSAHTGGTLVLEWSLAKTNPRGSGVTGLLLREGAVVDEATIAGDDTVGVRRRVLLDAVRVGERIDLAHTPWGPGGASDDGSDGSAMTLTVWLLPHLGPWLGTDLGASLQPGDGLLLRQRFDVPPEPAGGPLQLELRYDDGFVAWLDGAQVAADNAGDPDRPGSRAPADRPVAAAARGERFVLPLAPGGPAPGEHVLAVQVFDGPDDDGRLLALPILRTQRITVTDEAAGYLARPTPGEVNAELHDDLGPRVVSLSRWVPVRAGQAIEVLARVEPVLAPVTGVTLVYRVGFGPELGLPMFPAGLHTYRAVIPGEGLLPGTLVRWYALAADEEGRTARLPAYTDPADSEQYTGTVVSDPSVGSALPVLHWFVQNPDAANSSGGTRCTVWFGGELYDNVAVNLHGQSSRGFPKKSHNFDLPRDHRLLLRADGARMKDFDLLSNYADKSKVRNTLAYETFRDAGADYHLVVPLRVQRNGEFYAVYELVEDGDDRWLQRLGYPAPVGALYKMYDRLADPSRGEKKTRRGEDDSDLAALIAGLSQPEPERTLFVYDHVDLAAMANYLAAMFLVSNQDCCHKNYYAYRDSDGDGRWWYLPWDEDLTFGHNWTGHYFDDTIYSDTPLYVGRNNTLISALYAIPAFDEMYLRRVRTLADELLQPPGTPPGELRFERRLAELERLMGPDAELDNERWPTWGEPQTFAEGMRRLRELHLARRREFIYGTLVSREQQGERLVLLDGGRGATEVRYRVDTGVEPGQGWTLPDYDDSDWAPGTLGLGYEDSPAEYSSFISTTVRPRDVDPGATGVQVRILVQVEDPASLAGLVLHVRADDGYVAWLNGLEVARRNVVGDPGYGSTATNHPDDQVVMGDSVDLSAHLDLLLPGSNLLCVQVLNTAAGSSDLLLQLELADQAAAASGPLPAAQGEVALAFFGWEASQGTPEQAWLALHNPEGVAVDVSGWLLLGAGISHRFRPGTVIPTDGVLYVVADATAFRSRAQPPTGGQGLVLQGPWQGRLVAADPGELRVLDAAGQPVALLPRE